MRTPSRLMPKAENQSVKPLGWLFLAFFVGWLIYLCLSYPLASLVITLLLSLATSVGNRRFQQSLKKLTALRPQESICTFARSFERYTVDTWVIRAVYEELQSYLGDGSTNFPLRAEDDLFKDLQIDEEDLEMDIAESIAQRTGRTLNNASTNPLYGKVYTVRDLVLFFNAQHPAS